VFQRKISPRALVTGTHRRKFYDFVRCDRLGPFVNLVRDVLGCWTAVRDVVFDTEIIVRPSRVVTCSQKDAAIGLVLSDDV
jgi:hypothetical protein